MFSILISLFSILICLFLILTFIFSNTISIFSNLIYLFLIPTSLFLISTSLFLTLISLFLPLPTLNLKLQTMLVLNITRIANLRGINHVFSFLRKLGISHNVAGRYASGEALSFSFTHLLKICTALNCTPNDLIQFVPNQTQPLTPNHPLNNLQKNNLPENFKQLLQNLPLEKFNQIAQIISSEKNEAQRQ